MLVLILDRTSFFNRSKTENHEFQNSFRVQNEIATTITMKDKGVIKSIIIRDETTSQKELLIFQERWGY